MKLHVLGSSSAGNGYILEASNQALLIECGCPIKSVKEALNFNISNIVGALVSHSHGDHSKYVSQYVASGIKVYASSETVKGFKGVDEWWSDRAIEAGKMFQVGNFKVIPFEVKHDVPCLGFFIDHPESGRILFATDTHYIPNTFRGLNQVLIECNYEQDILNENLWNGTVDNLRYERTQRSHMSLETCIEALKANDLKLVRNIALIHLSPQNSNAETFQKKVIEATGKTVHIAKKGLVIDFNKDPY